MGTEEICDLLLPQASSAEAQIIKSRDRFTRMYCIEKQWDIENLSTEQLLEIRRQPGWKDAEDQEKRRRCCPFCKAELGLGVGMGTMIRECSCENVLIWIPTLKGGHWDSFTQAHFGRMHSDFNEVLDTAACLGSKDSHSG